MSPAFNCVPFAAAASDVVFQLVERAGILESPSNAWVCKLPWVLAQTLRMTMPGASGECLYSVNMWFSGSLSKPSVNAIILSKTASEWFSATIVCPNAKSTAGLA